MIPILTPADSEAWDAQAETAGIDRATLMECAGRAAATVLLDRFPQAARQGVLVACGSGNNGGDGWVLARALHRLDIPVWVAAIAGGPSPLAALVAARARAEGVREVPPDGPWPAAGVLVDALLGTGARGAPRATVAALMERLIDLALPLVALDGPTGLDLLNGTQYGHPRADLSITFGGVRRGHLLARDEVGDLVVVDIGHPPPQAAVPRLLTDALAAEWLPRLQARDHKGDRGRIVVVGGDAGMSGAIRMAGRAAFAAGAGLVHAVAPEATIATLTVAEPDLQTLAQDFGRPPSPHLAALVDRADVLLIGPGLGRGPGRRELVTALVGRARAIVLDADALTAFVDGAADLRPLVAGKAVVLTPHPGEFRTMFPALAGDLEHDPWTAATAAVAAVGATVLLKGVPTVVASPSQPPWTIAAGNPGLATGGSGDILSGLIAAALAQGLEPHRAAALGAQVLGRAADLAARRTAARSLRPMDVVAALPDLWRAWRLLRESRPAVRAPILLELERPATD